MINSLLGNGGEHMLTILRYDGSGAAPVTSCFLATARSCLIHLIRRFHPGVVVLPGMAPAGLTRPFEHEKIPIRYYRLTETLEPDVADAERLIRGTSRPIVIVVHYFGYAMPTYEIAVTAHEYGGILVGDCAHCITAPDPDSDCADVTLYSLNKVLPITDGALMYSRSPAVDVTKSDRIPPFPQGACDAYRNHMLANRLVACCPMGRYPIEALRQSACAYDDYYEIIDRDMEAYEPSALSAKIFAGTDLEAFRRRRWANADAIYRMLPQEQILRSGTPTFAFPVLVRNRGKAAAAVQIAGAVASWIEHRWRAPAIDDPALRFFRNHLLLPIGEGVDPVRAERLAYAVCGL